MKKQDSFLQMHWERDNKLGKKKKKEKEKNVCIDDFASSIWG